MQKTHDLFPGLIVLFQFTEFSQKSFCYQQKRATVQVSVHALFIVLIVIVSLGSWETGESYAYDIIGDLNAWAVGWVDWNMLLDKQGKNHHFHCMFSKNHKGGPNHLNNFCDASLLVDTDGNLIIQVIHCFANKKFSRVYTVNILLHGSDFKICGSRYVY